MTGPTLTDAEYRDALAALEETERIVLIALLLGASYRNVALGLRVEIASVNSSRWEAVNKLKAHHVLSTPLKQWVRALPREEQLALVGKLWDRLPLPEPPHHI